MEATSKDGGADCAKQPAQRKNARMSFILIGRWSFYVIDHENFYWSFL